jgi:hypothetical protein
MRQHRSAFGGAEMKEFQKNKCEDGPSIASGEY